MDDTTDTEDLVIITAEALEWGNLIKFIWQKYPVIQKVYERTVIRMNICLICMEKSKVLGQKFER